MMQEEDEEEHFEDIPDDDDDDGDVTQDLLSGADDVTQDLLSGEEENKEDDTNKDESSSSVNAPSSETQKSTKKGYDYKSRNPLYSGAENTCMWEITELCDHYHPSVCHFANLIREVRTCNHFVPYVSLKLNVIGRDGEVFISLKREGQALYPLGRQGLRTIPY